jgi:hypothetical protein
MQKTFVRPLGFVIEQAASGILSLHQINQEIRKSLLKKRQIVPLVVWLSWIKKQKKS